MKNESVSIASLGLATPPHAVKQSEAEAFMRSHYSKVLEPRSLSKMIKIFAHPSVLNRYIAVKDLECLVNEEQDARIDRFKKGPGCGSGRYRLDAAISRGCRKPLYVLYREPYPLYKTHN